jgi:hypothetical protein
MPTQKRKGTGKLNFDPFSNKADLINKMKNKLAKPPAQKITKAPRRSGSRGS